MEKKKDVQGGERVIKYIIDEISFSEENVQILSKEMEEDIKKIQGVINLMYKDTDTSRKIKKIDYITNTQWGTQKLIRHLENIEGRSEDMRMSIDQINEKLHKMEEST